MKYQLEFKSLYSFPYFPSMVQIIDKKDLHLPSPFTTLNVPSLPSLSIPRHRFAHQPIH